MPESSPSFSALAPRPLPIVVVGAGAAGLMAAIHAGRVSAGRRPVLLLERTRDGGRKILVSGGGRCNVLPAVLAPERFVTASSPNTLRKMLTAWPLAEQLAFFTHEARVPLKLEADSAKYFPQSDKARDVRDALLRLVHEAGARIQFDARMVGLARDGDSWRVDLEGGESLSASAVIVASGGMSLPGTGSDGGGLALLQGLGHTVEATYPALTPLLANPPVHVGLAGVSRDVTVRAPGAGPKGRPLLARGGFLFTHRGYSGPAVLDVSHLAVTTRNSESPQRLEVQWTDADEATWDQRLHATGGTSFVGPLLERHLESRLAARLLEECGIDPHLSLARLRREDRLNLVAALARYPLPWTGDEGYAKAEVTGGGVALSEVDARTLESRLHPGLFLCGELLDAFGPIGGHNFAWAWATGRAAGVAAGAKFV